MSRLLDAPRRLLTAARRGGGGNWTGGGPPHELPPESQSTLSADLKSEATRLGLGPTLITSPRASARFNAYLAWLADGLHGEMSYLARDDRVARRRDPHLVLPDARSVIMTSLYYWPGKRGFPRAHEVRRHAKGGGDAQGDGDAHGVMSCYAWGADYHALLEARLRALGEYVHARAGGVGRYYVDTGAVLERDFAERAGLGFVGKNSLVIHPRAGSGFFIGALFTSVALPLDGDADVPAHAPRARGPGCGGCTRCMDACPTRAIVRDRVVDARRCISYLTIELKGRIPEALRPAMGARVYGCDICQQVCPWNAFDWDGAPAPRARAGASPLFGDVSADVATPALVPLLWATKDAFRARFRGSAAKRIGRDRLARNAAVALGNVGGRRELPAVGAAARAHPSPLVREHARWAEERILERLKGGAERLKEG